MKHLAVMIIVAGTYCGTAVAAKPRPSAAGELPTSEKIGESLAATRAALDRERREITEESSRLDKLRGDILAKIKELSNLRASLRASLKNENDKKALARAKRVHRMAKSLTSMTPAMAAVAIAQMDDNLAVEMLLSMDSRKVGKILENMKAERAAGLVEKVILSQKE